MYWKVWAGVFLIFLLGTLCGALGMQSYLKRSIVADFRRPREPDPAAIVRHIDREIGLREEQKQALKPVFASMSEKIRDTMRQHHALVETIVAETDAAAAAFLDEDQKQRFAVMVERMKAMRRAMPPPPPPCGGMAPPPCDEMPPPPGGAPAPPPPPRP